MLTKPGHHRLCLALGLITLAGVYAGTAAADECDDLAKSLDNKLEDFLQKKLAFELLSRQQELMASWKTEYDRFDKVSDKIVASSGATTLDDKKIAADLAENSYLKAHSKWKDNCAGD